MDKAYFAAGCFWGVEETFRNIKGVLQTSVGYMGGQTENPSYKAVCTGETGHAEAVEVTFDANIISYSELLEVFWKVHNPTTLNRQGPDIGTQYRSAIFVTNDSQKTMAEKSKKEKQSEFNDPIVTEIKSYSTYYMAEEYHQQYVKKNGSHCNIY